MSRIFTVGAVSLLAVASAVAAAAPTPTSSTGRTIGYTPRSVYVSQRQTPATPVCPPYYDPEHTRTYARAYCPDIGDAHQLFIAGQVIPAGFGQPIGYAQLTSALRTEYRLDPERDFVWARGYLYDVDHSTKAIRRVIPVEIQR